MGQPQVSREEIATFLASIKKLPPDCDECFSHIVGFRFGFRSFTPPFPSSFVVGLILPPTAAA